MIALRHGDRCAALQAIVATPAIVGLMLKGLGLVHGAVLHTWLFDVGQIWDGAGRLERRERQRRGQRPLVVGRMDGQSP